MDVKVLVREDLAESKSTETEITLCWNTGPSVRAVLFELRRWRQLRKLTLDCSNRNPGFPPFEELSNFILGMKHLSHLQIVPHGFSSSANLETLRGQVNQFVLPRRPNFKFANQ